mmetsp:Transcript_40418/g.35876  ORF Transcript_40418/g.35876 Transcript_40418/m.35876 type:complete len:331 (+) Transcript_40418:50-1042(+)
MIAEEQPNTIVSDSSSHASHNIIQHTEIQNQDSFQLLKKLNNSRHPVYLVYHSGLDQHLVMKIFHHDEQKRPPLPYLNEIRFLEVDHPHIINYVSAESDRSLQCGPVSFHFSYTMSQYLPNDNLLNVINAYPQLFTDKLIRTYFLQLLDAIEYLHQNEIAHLDLKLENTVLDARYSLRLIDFDLAYHKGDKQILSKGTAYYRAPELAKLSKEINPFAADVYSLGCILFILKSGGAFPHLENKNHQGVNLFNLLVLDKNDFWEQHEKFEQKEKGFYTPEFRELFEGMTSWDAEERWSLKKIRESEWLDGDVYSQDELEELMTVELSKLEKE